MEISKGSTALAAVIQMCSTANRDENLAEANRLMSEAVRKGAQLLVLPENFSFMGKTGAEKRTYREALDQSVSLTFLQEFARRHQVWIVGGSIPIAIPGADRVASACFLLDADGAIRARYDKIHLFDVDLGTEEPYRESDTILAGGRTVVADTPFGRMGLSVCYDLRFPELYRQLVAQGATILVVPAAFTLTTGKDHWELLLRARAVENFSYVLAANQWGRRPDGRYTYGHSMIVEPWGMVLARSAEGVGIAMAEMDPNRVNRCRARIPCLEHRVLP